MPDVPCAITNRGRRPLLKPRSNLLVGPTSAVGALHAILKAEPIDPAEAEFRRGTVSAGAWVTVIVCVPALIYAFTLGGKSDWVLFFGVWVVALICGLTAFTLPWRAIIASRWREVVFLTWTLLDLALIAVAAIADGGPSSPVTGLFFIPIVFVGGSYPTSSVKLVGAFGLVGYAVFALVFGEPLSRAVLVLGGLGAVALMSWLQAQNHERRRLELAYASITDPLTGALNRRGLDSAADASLAALQRSGTPAALILLDLDDFKSYNDAHGHAAGDALLTWIGSRARRELRPMDSVARIGGDEFAVLVANADAGAAAKVARRIEAACSDRVLLCTGSASAPQDGYDFDSLYRAADSALYGAKRRRAPAAAAAQTAKRQSWRGSLPRTSPT